VATDQLIPELDRKGLRRFGLMTGGIVAALFGLFFPWLLERAWPLWPWIVLMVLGSWAMVAPLTLKPIYHGWMKFGLLASRVTTPLILGTVFYLLISPIGLIRRIFGADDMCRSFDREVKSYRVPSTRSPVENLEKPF